MSAPVQGLARSLLTGLKCCWCLLLTSLDKHTHAYTHTHTPTHRDPRGTNHWLHLRLFFFRCQSTHKWWLCAPLPTHTPSQSVLDTVFRWDTMVIFTMTTLTHLRMTTHEDNDAEASSREKKLPLRLFTSIPVCVRVWGVQAFFSEDPKHKSQQHHRSRSGVWARLTDLLCLLLTPLCAFYLFRGLTIPEWNAYERRRKKGVRSAGLSLGFRWPTYSRCVKSNKVHREALWATSGLVNMKRWVAKDKIERWGLVGVGFVQSFEASFWNVEVFPTQMTTV